MQHLIPIHYRKFSKFLEYTGCEFVRQNGSHLIYRRSDLKRPIVFPASKELSRTVIFSNLKTLNIPKEKYLEILEKIK